MFVDDEVWSAAAADPEDVEDEVAAEVDPEADVSMASRESSLLILCLKLLSEAGVGSLLFLLKYTPSALPNFTITGGVLLVSVFDSFRASLR